MRKNVLIFQRRLTSYRIPLFELMKEKLESQGVQLILVYGEPKLSEIDRQDSGQLHWGENIPREYFSLFGTELVWHRIPKNILNKADLIIIPHEGTLLANYPILFWRMLRKRKVAFWGHGGNFQANGSRLKDKFKFRLARCVDWWFAYTSLSVDRVKATGFSSSKITCLNNAIDINSLQYWRNKLTEYEQSVLLKKLDLIGEQVCVYLGGLIEEKRLDFLVNSVDEIKKKIPEFELLIIGNGPKGDYILKEVAKRPWTRWVGALHGEEKVKHLSLGKLLLNPGLVGLNILDSFTMGIPLITTDCGLHSPEIAYLRNRQNGLISNNNISSYVNAVVDILLNNDLRKRLSENCIIDAQNYTLEKMTDNFCAGILSAFESGHGHKSRGF